MKYKIIKDNNAFGIKEIVTEQIIKTFAKRDNANKYMTHLNSGGGFAAGLTFMLKKVA